MHSPPTCDVPVICRTCHAPTPWFFATCFPHAHWSHAHWPHGDSLSISFVSKAERDKLDLAWRGRESTLVAVEAAQRARLAEIELEHAQQREAWAWSQRLLAVELSVCEVRGGSGGGGWSHVGADVGGFKALEAWASSSAEEVKLHASALHERLERMEVAAEVAARRFETLEREHRELRLRHSELLATTPQVARGSFT